MPWTWGQGAFNEEGSVKGTIAVAGAGVGCREQTRWKAKEALCR